MFRCMYGKEGDKVIVLDMRDFTHGYEYAVCVLANDGGYYDQYYSPSLKRCIEKAKELEHAVFGADGLPIREKKPLHEFAR